jgi:hypothetical protein
LGQDCVNDLAHAFRVELAEFAIHGNTPRNVNRCRCRIWNVELFDIGFDLREIVLLFGDGNDFEFVGRTLQA